MNNPSHSQRPESTADLVRELSALFIEIGHAHHEAFADVNGVDPDWPLWYSRHLHGRLGQHLSAELTKAELVHLLVMADRERNLRAPGARWPQYYARFFVERYL